MCRRFAITCTRRSAAVILMRAPPAAPAIPCTKAIRRMPRLRASRHSALPLHEHSRAVLHWLSWRHRQVRLIPIPWVLTWFEAFLDWTLVHNGCAPQPIHASGALFMGRGRDAADVAMSTAFGIAKSCRVLEVVTREQGSRLADHGRPLTSSEAQGTFYVGTPSASTARDTEFQGRQSSRPGQPRTGSRARHPGLFSTTYPSSSPCPRPRGREYRLPCCECRLRLYRGSARPRADCLIREVWTAIIAFARRANIPVHIVPAPPKPRPDEPDPTTTTSTPLTPGCCQAARIFGPALVVNPSPHQL